MGGWWGSIILYEPRRGAGTRPPAPSPHIQLLSAKQAFSKTIISI